MKEMTLKEVIKIRQHKYDKDLKCSCAEWHRGYMNGWYWAYQDLLEILEHNNFDTSQIVIKDN